MAQNLSIEDVAREARTTYATYGEAGGVMFCDASRGMTRCDRPCNHNGKHAALTNPAYETATDRWTFTRIVRF